MSVNIIGKITGKYEPKKPGDNYTVYVSGSDGEDYRVYLPQCDYGKDDFVQIQGATGKTSGNGKTYYQANNITTVAQNEQSPEPTPQSNGQTTEPKTIPVSSGLSKGEEMLITGIWTRGVTSNKSADDLEAYADRALQYIRKQIGGDDDPFNDQF
jgi:hypothetical protein|tara:strand:- start:1669 stop:2133 length:465 start_codon:yes stop_codon:yes gene_type:complete